LSLYNGLSQQWEGQPRDIRLLDGSDWTVSEDWEANSGLVNDILFNNSVIEPQLTTKLQEWFINEPVFWEVVKSIAQLGSTGSLRDWKCARYRASQYMIEEGKLWHLWGGTAVRA
jgi:hypothetical protein